MEAEHHDTPEHGQGFGTDQDNHEGLMDSAKSAYEIPEEYKHLQESEKRAARLIVGATVNYDSGFYEEVLERSLNADIRLGIIPIGGILVPKLQIGLAYVSGAEEIKRFLKNHGNAMEAHPNSSREYLKQPRSSEGVQLSSFNEEDAEKL